MWQYVSFYIYVNINNRLELITIQYFLNLFILAYISIWKSNFAIPPEHERNLSLGNNDDDLYLNRL